jgi:hypothetical protein
MDHQATELLAGIGTPDELVDLWESIVGRPARDLRYQAVCSLFKLGSILFKLFGQMRDNGLMTPEFALEQSHNSPYVQQLCQILDLTPAGEITAPVPDVSFLR